MTMTQWNRPFPPLSIGQIEQFEESLGTPLPPAYRTYLLSQNGGFPTDYLTFHIPAISDDRGSVMLGALFGIGRRGSGLDLETQVEELKDVVPQGYIPIGADPGGNLLLLTIGTPFQERIVFWDRVGFLARTTGWNLFPVAEDINQFLESLRHMRDS